MNVTASNEGMALLSILSHASFVVQLVMLVLLYVLRFFFLHIQIITEEIIIIMI